MNPLRAIAEHYASLPNTIVPADRFTEGHRSQLDKLPAITYGRSTESEDYHQTGPGFTELSVEMNIYAETESQAGRIRDQLRGIFHLVLSGQWVGSDPENRFFCKHSFHDSTVDSSDFDRGDGGGFVPQSTMYVSFIYAAPQPAPPT